MFNATWVRFARGDLVSSPALRFEPFNGFGMVDFTKGGTMRVTHPHKAETVLVPEREIKLLGQRSGTSPVLGDILLSVTWGVSTSPLFFEVHQVTEKGVCVFKRTGHWGHERFLFPEDTKSWWRLPVAPEPEPFRTGSTVEERSCPGKVGVVVRAMPFGRMHVRFDDSIEARYPGDIRLFAPHVFPPPTLIHPETILDEHTIELY